MEYKFGEVDGMNSFVDYYGKYEGKFDNVGVTFVYKRTKEKSTFEIRGMLGSKELIFNILKGKHLKDTFFLKIRLYVCI